MWVWNIDRKEVDNLVAFAKEENIDGLLISSYDKKILNKLKDFRVEYLFGIAGDWDVDKIVNKANKIRDRFNAIHLDIEFDSEEIDLEDFLVKYKQTLKGIKGKVNVDVQTWIKDKRYREILKKYSNELYLMNYTKSLLVRLWKTIGYTDKSFLVGFETSGDESLKKISYRKKRNLKLALRLTDAIFRWFNNYEGNCIHYYYPYKELR